MSPVVRRSLTPDEAHQVKDLVEAIVDGFDPHPTFADGLQVQRVLAAVEQSSEHESAWVRVGSDVLTPAA